MFRSSVLVTLITLIASFLGFFVHMLLASRYGAGVDVDAYLFALSAPTLVAGLISAVMTHELVPRLVADESDQIYQRRLITTLLLGISLVAVGLVVAGFGLGMVQRRMLLVDSPIALHRDLALLLNLGWSVAAIQIVQSYLAAVLTAHRQYTLNAILLLLPYAGMIFSMLLIGGRLGITALPLGTLIGFIVAAVCSAFVLRRHLFPLQLSQLLWPEIRQLASRSPYTSMAMTCFSSYAIVDAYWATRAGEGTMSALGYSQRLVIAFGNLAVAGPLAVLVPRFAELIREKDFIGFRRALSRALMVAGCLAGIVALAMSLYAHELVRFLFGRGSFDQADVGIVAQTIRAMMPGMIAMLLSAILLRAIFCLRGIARVVGGLGLFWPVAYFAVSMATYKLGAPGLGLGYSLVWILYLGILSFVIHKLTSKRE